MARAVADADACGSAGAQDRCPLSASAVVDGTDLVGCGSERFSQSTQSEDASGYLQLP